MLKKLIVLILTCVALSLCLFTSVAFADEGYINVVLDDNFLVIRGDWEVSNEGLVTQTDTISSGSSFRRMIAYKDAYKNATIEFDMLLVSASSSEAWCGVAFNKAKATDAMELSGYLVALKDYGQLQVYNWNKTQVLADVAISGENYANKKEPHSWHTYKITCEGDKISVFVDGVEVVSVTDSTYTQGYISLNSGDSVCSFKNIKINGEVVKMTIYTQPSDGDVSNEELEERNVHFDANKNSGKATDVGKALAVGGAAQTVKNYLEDTFIDVGNKTPKSYVQLFVIGIAVTVIFVAVSICLIIKMVKAGNKK